MENTYFRKVLYTGKTVLDGVEYPISDGVIHKTKAEAEQDEEHFDGKTTE